LSASGRSRRCAGSKSRRTCRKNKYGFAPLGDANRATKQLIFGGNATKFYKIRRKAAENTRMPVFSEDRLAALKNEYTLAAMQPSNLRYGYVRAA
jgi:uncharacterized protein